MRKRFALQHELGVAAIEEIIIPTKSRDELPPVLDGLTTYFCNRSIIRASLGITRGTYRVKENGENWFRFMGNISTGSSSFNLGNQL